MTRRVVLWLAAVAVAMCTGLWLATRASDPSTGPAVAPGDKALVVELPEGPAELRDVAGAAPVQPAPLEARAPEEPSTERRPVAAPVAWSAPLRGQVVDERTGTGVARVTVTLFPGDGSSPSSATDDGGRFTSGRSHPAGRLRVTTRDSITGTSLRELWHRHRPGADGGAAAELLVPVQIGPTYRVQVVGGPIGDGIWRAQLVERSMLGEERAWSHTVLLFDAATGELWARWAEIEHAPELTWSGHLLVSDRQERFRGEAPVPSTLGTHPVLVRVEPLAASLSGHVRDQDGLPIAANVLALYRGAPGNAHPEVREKRTDEDGRYELTGLAPGSLRLLVATDHRPPARAEVEILAGEERVQDFTLSRVILAGPIRGALQGPPESEEPFALVHLVSTDGGATDLVALAGFDLFGSSDGEGRSEFEFEDLPEGRYELTLLPLDGRTYTPESLVVTPPSDSALFTTDQLAVDPTSSEMRLIVRDRESGESLRDAVFLPYLAPFWGAQTVDWDEGAELDRQGGGLDLRWVVAAPGHRPVFVSMADLLRGGEQDPVHIDLAPGWGAALVVVDAERTIGGSEASFSDILPMPGLPGARIVVAGRTVGTSGATGLALCASDGPIESLGVHLPGWSALSVERFGGHAATPDGIGFVLMVRD